MEEQKFWISIFRSVCLKVLRNAVRLSYHAPESVHGAQRTKQKKISNFDMVGIAVHEEENKETNHVEVWNLVLFRSPSSVNRFQTTVPQKNSVAEYFQTNWSKFEISKFLILHFRFFDFLLSKILTFWTRKRHENANISPIWKNQRYHIRYFLSLLLK